MVEIENYMQIIIIINSQIQNKEHNHLSYRIYRKRVRIPYAKDIVVT
jgi:hypothetical protein